MKFIFSAVAALSLVSTGIFAGEPVNTQVDPNRVCLNAGEIDHMSYPDDKTILFHMNVGKVRVWRNDLKKTCQGLHFEDGTALEIRGGIICANMQEVYVLNRWTPCFLGPFTPVSQTESGNAKQ